MRKLDRKVVVTVVLIIIGLVSIPVIKYTPLSDIDFGISDRLNWLIYLIALDVSLFIMLIERYKKKIIYLFLAISLGVIALLYFSPVVDEVIVSILFLLLLVWIPFLAMSIRGNK